MISTYEFSH
jgi:hypothetical protein